MFTNKKNKMLNKKIVLESKNFTEEVWNNIINLIGGEFVSFQTGKSKSEKLEARMRKSINEPRPKTTDYDFCNGEGYFFVEEKVELKQFTSKNGGGSAQQVKPALYDVMIVVAEFTTKAEWWVIKTEKISKFSGKNNKEKNKLTLQKQHKGNLEEGQISFNKEFKKNAKHILTSGPIIYDQENLGLSDETVMEILNAAKNIKD